MNTSTLVRPVVAALLAGSVGAAFAADIMMVQPHAPTVALDSTGKAVVRFAVSGNASSSDHCGYFVEYGDGMAGDSRVIERENGGFNRQHERTFTSPGTFTVKASGKSVKTTAGCNGAATTTVTVVAGRQARMSAAPACPEGWQLIEKSVNRRTGAFNCGPKPAGQLVCGDGLRYFERDGLIGCRAGRRS